MHKTVYVKDYVTLPCEDAAPGIMAAVEEAKRIGADVLEFEAGVYSLKQVIDFETDQTAHDAGGVFRSTKDVHILLHDLHNCTVTGQVDENGKPVTVLEGINDLKLHDLMPSVLWVDGGSCVTVQNFKFRRNPEFCSSGQVESVDGKTVYVKVFEGNPCYDNMGTYCMNKFTSDGDLDGESLSYGPGLGVNFRLVGERLLSLESEKVADRVMPGDILTFHQGSRTDFQCFYGNVDQLTLRNLHTTNSNGFASLAFNIHNLTIDHVRFQPEGNQYFTAPRDAFKLHKCHGHIKVDGMYVEGVRMDGQNMHSNYVQPVNRISANTVQFFSRYAKTPLVEGSDMEFYFGEEKKTVKIKSWSHGGRAERDGHYGNLLNITFEEALDWEISEKDLCLPACWEPDLYECTDSHFRNVAGAGHLSRIDHMRISGCTFTNMMNAGILLGAEYPTHIEGGHCTDIRIWDCVFDNCGTTARYGAAGCIGIKSAGLPGKNNKDIRIENCLFRNSPIGVDIHDADDVMITNCGFDNITQLLRVDEETCGSIICE